MTQDELNAGGKAFMDLATAKGYGSWVDIDAARGVAAAIITAVDKFRVTAKRVRTPTPMQSTGASGAPSNMAENAPVGPAPEGLAVDTLAGHMRDAERWVRDVAHVIVSAGAPKP